MMNKNDVINIAADGSSVYAQDVYEADSDKFANIDSLAEAVGHFYKGKMIQVYWSDSGGSTNYSDFEISSQLYIEGRVLWGRGEVFALECEVTTALKKFKTVVLFNSYNVYMITPLDGVDITHCFKGRLKKNKSQGLP
jgi:hypothetical protein